MPLIRLGAAPPPSSVVRGRNAFLAQAAKLFSRIKRVMRCFVDATSNLLCADWLLEGSNRPGRGQDEKTSGTDQQAVHSGAGRRDSWAPSPLFYLAPRYDPPG